MVNLMTMTPSTLNSDRPSLFSDARVHAAILVLAVGIVYSNTLGNGFVWDDTILFIGKEFYASFGVLKVLSTGWHRVEYLPVRDMTYIADHALWGWSPFGFHLTNVVFFALTVVVVYALSVEIISLLQRYASSAYSEDIAKPAALFIATLFAVHPLQSQSVSFVTCRNVLVSGLFFFLSLVLFLRHLDLQGQRAGRLSYLLSLLCFSLAVLSKATVIILPMILIVIVLFNAKQKKIPALVLVLPFAVLSVVFYVLHKQVAVQAKLIREDLFEFGIHNTAMTAAKAVQIPFFYLCKVVFPKDLIAEYDITFIRSLFHPGVLIALTVLFCGAWLAWKYRRSQPAVLFGFLWFIVTLIPVMNFYPTRPVVADRYAFLPLYGIFLPLGLYTAMLLRSRMRHAVIVAACALVILLAYLAHGQNRIWESDITLWTDAASKAPQSFKPYANLGYAYRKAGDRAKSDEMFRMAGEMEPSFADHEYLRGIEAYRAKDYPAAIRWFENALMRKPGLIRALFYTGLAYDRSGDHEQAMKYLLDIRESPEYDIDNYRAGAVHYINNYLMPRFAPMLDDLKRAAEVAPEDHLRWVRLADAMISSGQDDEAAKIYRKLVEQGKADWSVHYHLGEISRRAGDQAIAITQYTKSLEMRKPNCEVSCRLGTLFMKRREHDAAERILKSVLRDDPSCADARFHLAVSYFQRGNADQARIEFTGLERSYPGNYPVKPYISRIPAPVY